MSTTQRRPKSLYAMSAAAFRWVHIYVSMLGFTMLMFFGVTGITLNHPTWFGGDQQMIQDLTGQIPTRLMSPTVDRLELAERLRAEHGLKGKVAELTVDEYEIMVVFKGPGYAADVFVDRETGDYSLTETASGMMAVLNDLHKGRDSGSEWSLVIDVSAIITVLMSVSGFGLIFYIRRRRLSGIATAVAGTIILVSAWAVWVP